MKIKYVLNVVNFYCNKYKIIKTLRNKYQYMKIKLTIHGHLCFVFELIKQFVATNCSKERPGSKVSSNLVLPSKN